eukprot:1347253-Amorphochlora_amoeboformis.AAC.1
MCSRSLEIPEIPGDPGDFSRSRRFLEIPGIAGDRHYPYYPVEIGLSNIFSVTRRDVTLCHAHEIIRVWKIAGDPGDCWRSTYPYNPVVNGVSEILGDET